MKYIAGVDVGNNSTEVAIAKVSLEGDIHFLASAMVKTTGIKGTLRNVQGIIDALDIAIEPLEIQRKDISLVLLNKATPVIGDVAMETITETVITESAMIGHNPSTPGGMGLGLGTTISLEDLRSASPDERWIVVIDGSVEFREAAARLNEATSMNLQIEGAIVRKDEAVLIYNRLHHPIPIVDEVLHIERVPMGMPAAIEVAPIGKTIENLWATQWDWLPW